VDSAVFYRACDLLAAMWQVEDFAHVIADYPPALGKAIQESLCPVAAVTGQAGRPLQSPDRISNLILAQHGPVGSNLLPAADGPQQSACLAIADPALRRRCSIRESVPTMPQPSPGGTGPTLRTPFSLDLMRPEAIQPNVQRQRSVP
jgi:hypothetical protein